MKPYKATPSLKKARERVNGELARRILVEIQLHEDGITHEVRTDLPLDEAHLEMTESDFFLTVDVLRIRVSREGIAKLLESARKRTN